MPAKRLLSPAETEREGCILKKRILAVSDIHGCADLLVSVLKQSDYDPRTDQLILLGDYIDRGEQGYETVQLVKSLTKDGAVALMGNHEDMAIQTVESNGIEQWFANGGRTTIRSYARNRAFIEDDIDFFKSLPLYYETEEYIFVHAGLYPADPRPEASDRDTLLWIRGDWLNCEYDGKPVIFGHTPNPSLIRNSKGNKIGIDTGAVFWGTLTCLELPNLKIYSTIKGESKTNDLSREQSCGYYNAKSGNQTCSSIYP